MIRNLLGLSVLCFVIACGSVQRPDGGKGLLPVGSLVSDLKGEDQDQRPVVLRNGEVSVVYFYPKDGTPGCTKEACAFRDAWDRYQAAKVRVIGVSADSPEDHREFAKEHGLKFSLISDPEHVWSNAFGVGTVIGMDKRVTFLVGADGKVLKIYADVDPGVHASEVLADAAQLAPAAP